jgi:hypothetical protein
MVNNNDLIVMVEFDPMKTLEEHMFDTIPIWIRVFKLPLGMMNRSTGEMIGNRVGESMGVDVDDDDMAVGEYLRTQVRLNIKSPLMRGTVITVGEEEREIWCPFQYEYLPEFCFTCGIIGHDARGCSIKIKKGEKQQFGLWLRAYIPKKTTRNEKGRWEGARDRGNNRGYSFGGSGSRWGSDNLTWRKDISDDLSNTLKKQSSVSDGGVQKKLNSLAIEGDKVDGMAVTMDVQGQNKEKVNSDVGKEAEQWRDMENPPPMHGNGHDVGGKIGGGTEARSQGKFRRKVRNSKGSKEVIDVQIGMKRGAEPMEVEEKNNEVPKKMKKNENNVNAKAGLSEQLRESQ